MIFENDGDQDFVEIILTENEIDNLKKYRGVKLELPYGFPVLNIFIRQEIKREVENAIGQRKSCE